MACTATCYNTLARTANEASPYRQPNSPMPLPKIPEWQRPVPPASALTLKECVAERQAGLLRHWQSCNLLLTKERQSFSAKSPSQFMNPISFNLHNLRHFERVLRGFATLQEGSVHCYDGQQPDIALNGPVWSGRHSFAL